MFENMYDTPAVANQDPFAGMSPSEKAHNQQLDIQLGGNGSGQALLTRRGQITQGSGNFSQQEYDALQGSGGRGGNDYGWLGNAINTGFRDFAKDPTGTLMGIDLPGLIENELTFGYSDKLKNQARINPVSFLGNMVSTADNPDGVNGAPDVTWQSNIPAPPGQLTPRAQPAVVPPPPPSSYQGPGLREAPQRTQYGMNVGGWGFDGSKAGSQFQTSTNGQNWQVQPGNVAAGGAPTTGGWQAQQGTNTAPGDWTKVPPPPGQK